MIVYNVTIKVQKAIAADWLQWLKQEHIPDVINTGCFTNATTFQLQETDDADGPTYVVQYFAESKALYSRYINNHANVMRQKAFDKWGNQFIAFRTVMHIV